MKTIEINLYEFKELNEIAQKNALTRSASINILHDWWNCTYDDALTVGLEIESFDLRRGLLESKLVKDFNECIDIVLNEHGKDCKTYKTAKYFREAVDKLKDNEEMDDLEILFKRSMAYHYLEMLKTEYYYLIGNEAIKETFEANNHYFTESGEMYNN